MVLSPLFFALIIIGHRLALSFSPSFRYLPSSLSWSTRVEATSRHRTHSHFATPASGADIDNIIGTVALLVPSSDQASSKFGSKSPVPPPSYIEAAKQLARKIRHFSDGRILADVVTPADTGQDNEKNDVCLKSNALFALGLTTPSDIQYLSRTFRQRRTLQQQAASSKMCQFAIDCGGNNYAPICGPYDEANPSIVATIAPWSDVASGKRLAVQMAELFDKQSTDEFALAVMLFFNRFLAKVPWVEHSIDITWEKGIVTNAREIFAMITKCGPCITKCLADEECKACITALDEIDTRDQVTSYRTVVSFESELLRDFSLCILQKNNVFECSATIPKVPIVQPISEWRGKEVTEEVARGIMFGHIQGIGGESLEGSKHLDVSWQVACGANVAYDQFPSQNQLFYPSAKGKGIWYDPIFRVETIDGRNVWCKVSLVIRSFIWHLFALRDKYPHLMKFYSPLTRVK